jgi:hypothetical protein
MSKIYYDDEWKGAGATPAATVPRTPTRAEEQSRINQLYAHNKLTRVEWLRLTDELSEVSKWSASGKIK